MRVTEIFHSIQGESSHAGRPTTFVRLAGCNLRCVWCDSEYTFTGGERMTVEEVLEEVKAKGCRLVEITGGEPLLQKEAFELIERLCELDYEVMVETSGSVDIGGVDDRAVVVMDVKCPGSGEVDRNLLANLGRLRDRDELKFVIADRADYLWSREFLSTHQIDGPEILFSPVWDQLPLVELADWILEDGLDVRLQTQLHKHIWGPNVKGV